MRNDRVYEQSTGHAKGIKLKTLNEISKSLCIIKDLSQNQSSGFFLQIPNDKKTIYILVTSYRAISDQLIKSKQVIEIIPEIGNIKQTIKLDTNERKIWLLQDKDIIAIEILEKDNLINNVKFLNYDTKCKINEYGNYLNIDTFILHYPKGRDVECNCGRILDIKNQKEFQFLLSLYNEAKLPGSPILLFENEKGESLVIGVHTSFLNGDKTNVGTFINVLIEKIIGKKYDDDYDYLGISKNKKLIFKFNK